VFDDEGRPLEEKLEGAFSEVIAEKGELLTPQDPEIRAASLRERLRETAAADRERERERVRERHRLQKQKRKIAEANAAGLDARGLPKVSAQPLVLLGDDRNDDSGDDAGGSSSGIDFDVEGSREKNVKSRAKGTKASNETIKGSKRDSATFDNTERRAEEMLARLLPS